MSKCHIVGNHLSQLKFCCLHLTCQMVLLRIPVLCRLSVIVVYPGHIKSIFGPYLSDGSSKNSSTVQIVCDCGIYLSY